MSSNRGRGAGGARKVVVSVVSLFAATTLTACGDDSTVAAGPGDTTSPAARLTLPAVQQDERQAVVPGHWDGALLDDGARTLTVGFIGGPEYEAGNPCTVRYWLEVEESRETVRVRLGGAAPVFPSIQEPIGCHDLGHSRSASARLDEPLGGRRLVDAATGTPVVPVDGERLWSIGWLPEAYEPSWSGPAWAPEGYVGWQSTFAVARPATGDPPGSDSDPDGAVRCAPGRASIQVVQHQPPHTQPPVPSGERSVVSTHDVHGTTAEHIADDRPESGRAWLVWSGGGTSVQLGSSPACAGDERVPFEDLLRVARGMTPPSAR